MNRIILRSDRAAEFDPEGVNDPWNCRQRDESGGAGKVSGNGCYLVMGSLQNGGTLLSNPT